jgi:hypothetical protein
MEHLLK